MDKTEEGCKGGVGFVSGWLPERDGPLLPGKRQCRLYVSFFCFFRSFFSFFFVIGKEREREGANCHRPSYNTQLPSQMTHHQMLVCASDGCGDTPSLARPLSLSLFHDLPISIFQTCPRGKKENVSIRVVLTVRSFSDMPSWRNFWRKRSGHCPQLLWSVPFRILQYKVVTVPYRKRSYY